MGSTATTLHQLVARRWDLEDSAVEYRAAVIVFFVLCATAGAPLSWENRRAETLYPGSNLSFPRQSSAGRLRETR